jgi:hypothetical protein
MAVDQCVKTAVLSAMILFAACAAIGFMGWAQPIAGELKELISGNGSFDDSLNTQHAQTRAMASNGTVDYSIDRNWNETADTVDQSFAAVGKGTYKDQYVITTMGAGYSQTYRATNSKGVLTGSLHSVVTAQPNGGANLNTLVLMDGTAKFQANVINGTTGRPVEESQREMMGHYTLSRYVSITRDPASPPVGWLDFCGTINDDHPEGLLLVAPGSHYNNATKQIEKDNVSPS